MSVETLFQAVRDACSAGAWSQGVGLVRAQAVVHESESGGELTLRVSTRGGLISPGVHLYPENDDWECDCASRDDVCEHVAAAVIALRQGKGSTAAGDADGPGRIGYRLTRTGGGVSLDRVVVRGDQSAPLRATLTAVASGRVDGPTFVATPADLDIERTLGSRLRGELPRGLVARLLPRLADCADVHFDGQPITVSAEPVVPHGRLVEEDGGFRLSVGRDPSVTELIEPGLALCGDTLRVRGESRLTGRELDELGRGRFFPADDVAELVTEVLPSLRKRIPVDVVSGRLPRTVREKPRLRVEVKRERNRLSALATLVYGDPAIARVDSGRLVSFGGMVPIRDEEEEARLLRQLQRDLALLPGRRMLHAGEEALRFAEQLKHFSGEVVGDAHEGFYRASTLEAKLGLGDARVDVSFSPVGDESGTAVDAESVLRAWRDGDSLVALSDGGFAPLPVDWLERLGHRVSDLLAARDERGELPPSAMPDLARLCDEAGEPRPPAYETLRAMVERHDDIPEAALPADLHGTLRHYQQHGVDWMGFLREAGLGALLADDMGLGKTVQALCALRGRTLVVAPTSVVHNWASETKRFRPGLRASVYHGPGRRLDPKADLTLTTYSILRLDADALAAERWDTVILDEAQLIKNPDSQVARAAHRLSAGFRLALSGTPVENRLTELWSLFRVINPGLLGARADFSERYEKPIDRGDAEAAERLRERIRPFVLRRLKREVAPELPPRTEVVLHAELGADERDLYDAIRAATQHDLVAQLESGGNVLQALEALLRLRQAACHPALVPGGSAERSSKTDVLLELLDEAVADGHKVVVFSQWTSLLDLLEPLLEADDIGFTRLDGSTRDRAGVVETFQDPDGPPVMIASLRAGGIGLNLTAADHVVIFDPWWNPAAEDQAADRAHRIGQTRPVMVYRIVARDTVEERILALQEHKRAIADTALGAAERAGGVTREDLLTLLA